MNTITWTRGLALPSALLLLGLAAACSTAPAPKPTATAPEVIAQPGKKSITVSVADSGASIVLERGQDLVVRLSSPPTSRLEWAPVDFQPGVLAVRRAGYEQAGWGPSIEPGTEGTAYWQFAPQAAGQVVLQFALRQPHRLDPPAQTLRYTVTVR